MGVEQVLGHLVDLTHYQYEVFYNQLDQNVYLVCAFQVVRDKLCKMAFKSMREHD